jgi:hypothetical protein
MNEPKPEDLRGLQAVLYNVDDAVKAMGADSTRIPLWKLLEVSRTLRDIECSLGQVPNQPPPDAKP